jgi:hypothetical protein
MSNEATYETFAPTTFEDLLRSQKGDIQELIDLATSLVHAAAAVRRADGELARAFGAEQVRPWADEATKIHEELRVLVMSHLPELRAVVELVHQREAVLAVANHGDLLRSIRALDDKLEVLRRAAPGGISRVSMELTALAISRPSGLAEELLTILLPPSGSDIASAWIQDVKSRLVLETVPPEVRQGGAGHVRIWRDPAVTLALAQATEVPV